MRLLWSFVPLMAQPEYSWATGTTSPRCAISAFWGDVCYTSWPAIRFAKRILTFAEREKFRVPVKFLRRRYH